MGFTDLFLDRKWRNADFSARWRHRSKLLTDSEWPISYLCSIATLCLSLTVYKLLRFLISDGISLFGGKFLAILGAGDPQNMNFSNFLPQKARVSTEPRRLMHNPW